MLIFVIVVGVNSGTNSGMIEVTLWKSMGIAREFLLELQFTYDVCC